jgi:hypothetical protein
MTKIEVRAWIEGEATKFVKLIGATRKEKADDFLKSKVLAFIEALDGMNECEDDAAYQQLILAQYNASKGAVDAYHDILVKLEVPHNHP